jgi:methylenetetrahydrofolate reductase (NADPH)
MAAMNHAAIPDWLQERMDAVDGDPEAVRKLGVEVATEMCQQLLDAGVPGLHLYALNRANSIQEIYENLSLGLG